MSACLIIKSVSPFLLLFAFLCFYVAVLLFVQSGGRKYFIQQIIVLVIQRFSLICGFYPGYTFGHTSNHKSECSDFISLVKNYFLDLPVLVIIFVLNTINAISFRYHLSLCVGLYMYRVEFTSCAILYQCCSLCTKL